MAYDQEPRHLFPNHELETHHDAFRYLHSLMESFPDKDKDQLVTYIVEAKEAANARIEEKQKMRQHRKRIPLLGVDEPNLLSHGFLRQLAERAKKEAKESPVRLGNSKTVRFETTPPPTRTGSTTSDTINHNRTTILEDVEDEASSSVQRQRSLTASQIASGNGGQHTGKRPPAGLEEDDEPLQLKRRKQHNGIAEYRPAYEKGTAEEILFDYFGPDPLKLLRKCVGRLNIKERTSPRYDILQLIVHDFVEKLENLYIQYSRQDAYEEQRSWDSESDDDGEAERSIFPPLKLHPGIDVAKKDGPTRVIREAKRIWKESRPEEPWKGIPWYNKNTPEKAMLCLHDHLEAEHVPTPECQDSQGSSASVGTVQSHNSQTEHSWDEIEWLGAATAKPANTGELGNDEQLGGSMDPGDRGTPLREPDEDLTMEAETTEMEISGKVGTMDQEGRHSCLPSSESVSHQDIEGNLSAAHHTSVSISSQNELPFTFENETQNQSIPYSTACQEKHNASRSEKDVAIDQGQVDDLPSSLMPTLSQLCAAPRGTDAHTVPSPSARTPLPASPRRERHALTRMTGVQNADLDSRTEVPLVKSPRCHGVEPTERLEAEGMEDQRIKPSQTKDNDKAKTQVLEGIEMRLHESESFDGSQVDATGSEIEAGAGTGASNRDALTCKERSEEGKASEVRMKLVKTTDHDREVVMGDATARESDLDQETEVDAEHSERHSTRSDASQNIILEIQAPFTQVLPLTTHEEIITVDSSDDEYPSDYDLPPPYSQASHLQTPESTVHNPPRQAGSGAPRSSRLQTSPILGAQDESPPEPHKRSIKTARQLKRTIPRPSRSSLRSIPDAITAFQNTHTRLSTESVLTGLKFLVAGRRDYKVHEPSRIQHDGCYGFERNPPPNPAFPEKLVLESELIHLLPVNYRHIEHWVLVKIKGNRVFIYDSLANKERTKKLAEFMKDWMTYHSQWKVHRASIDVVPCPQQNDGHSCGVFALLFAEAIIKGDPLMGSTMQHKCHNIEAQYISFHWKLVAHHQGVKSGPECQGSSKSTPSNSRKTDHVPPASQKIEKTRAATQKPRSPPRTPPFQSSEKRAATQPIPDLPTPVSIVPRSLSQTKLARSGSIMKSFGKKNNSTRMAEEIDDSSDEVDHRTQTRGL